MRSVSYRLVDLDKVRINLGFQGENEHTQILFDCKKAFEEYPGAVQSLAVVSPHGEKYPAVTTRDGNYVSWLVSDADTAYAGDGMLQLSFIQGEVVKKTYRAKTHIHESINADGNPPSGVGNWLDTANQTLEELPTTAKQYALSALDEMTVEAETLPEGSSPEVVKTVDPDTGAINLDFKIPAGGGGTSDYEDLENKPTLGGVTLDGEVSLQDIGAYEKPSSGIPAEDIAEGVIPNVTGKANLTVIAPAFNQATANDAGSFVTYTDGVVYLLPDGHTAGATWANTSKTATNIGAQVSRALTAIDEIQTGGKLLSNPVKAALINLFDHVAYTDGNAQVYIQALKEAWKVTGTLVSISADFEQGSAVINIDDSLSTLRQYLTVTGTFTHGGNEFTEEVLDYTLSGTLTSGESTITATYEGKTAEFTVMVESELPSAYQKVEYIGATAENQYILFSDIQVADTDALKKYAFEIDFAYDSWNGVANTNIVAGFSSFGGLWIGYNKQVENIAMGTASGCFFTDNRPTDRHKYSFVYDQSTGLYGACSFVRDDSTSITRSLPDDDFNSHIFCLFSGVDSSSGSGRNSNFDFKGKIYAFSMTYEGDPYMNLVPCYRKADNVIGFYDTVGETFYTNSGSGTFTKGGNV